MDPKELPANSDRGLECYYVQAPRVSYLPLLVPELKKFLMEVVFDETSARGVTKEEDWWFEGEDGGVFKWSVHATFDFLFFPRSFLRASSVSYISWLLTFLTMLFLIVLFPIVSLFETSD